MKRFGKIKLMVATVACTVLLVGCSCAGKNVRFTTGLAKDEVFKIKGSACKLSEAMLLLTTEKNLYEKSYGPEIWSKSIDGVTFEEYVKTNVKNELADIKTLNLLAKEKDIKLTGDEKQQAEAIAANYFISLTQDEIKYMGVTEADAKSMYRQYFLANKVYEELTKDVNPEISDSEAKMIKVQSIYGKTYVKDNQGTRVEYTAEEKASVKEDMEDLLAEINNGGDFATIASNHTDAGQVEYQFGKGDMIAEFEAAAFGLVEGQVSGIVETPDGYYIIKCISGYLEDETQIHKGEMIQEAKDEAFLEIYTPFVENLTSQFNAKLWDSVKFSDMTNITVDNFYEMQNLS